jgi:hypothetical protein
MPDANLPQSPANSPPVSSDLLSKTLPSLPPTNSKPTGESRPAALKVIATLLLVMGVGAGIMLVMQKQSIFKKASEDYCRGYTNDVHCNVRITQADLSACQAKLPPGKKAAIYVTYYTCPISQVPSGGCNSNGAIKSWNARSGDKFGFVDSYCGVQQIDLGCTDTERSNTYGTVGYLVTLKPCGNPEPTATPAPNVVCNKVTLAKLSRNGTEISSPNINDIRVGDVVTFRAYVTTQSGQPTTVAFRVSKGGTAQSSINRPIFRDREQYVADLEINIDQPVNYDVSVVQNGK